MRKRKNIEIILNAAFFIVLEFAAITLLKSNNSVQDTWISRISHRVSASIWTGVDNLTSYLYLNQENKRLSEENDKLMRQLHKYKTLEATLIEQDQIVKLGTEDNFNFISATVVKLGINTAHNYIILDKGSNDGVKPQTGIISNKGVVGIITSVDKDYSYGISFLNSNLKVSVRIGKDDTQALLTWDGYNANRAILNDIPPHSIINIGDTVRTSGLSNLFPADIPIGKAVNTRTVDGTSIQVDVDLFQDFRSLRYVTITDFKDKDIIQRLENQ